MMPLIVKLYCSILYNMSITLRMLYFQDFNHEQIISHSMLQCYASVTLMAVIKIGERRNASN